MTDERIADLMGWIKPCAGSYSHGPADMLARIKRVVAEAETAEREALVSAIKDKADEWDDRAEAYGMLLAVDVITARSNAAAQPTAQERAKRGAA